MKAVKLDLGAGPYKLEGWTPVDRKLGSEVYPLAYPDNSVDAIRASHVLEHFPHAKTREVIADWVRVLKPGGLLKIGVPDMLYACKNFSDPHAEGWLMGGQVDEDDHHGALFHDRKLRTMMAMAGLEGIQSWKSELNDCAALDVSLNLMGKKPGTLIEEKPKIACAVSMPRLGFNDAWGCAVAAFQPWNMPIRRYTGVWWERSLQNMLVDMIAEGFEYAVTLDYDSLFTPADFNTLFSFIIDHPEVDAVSPFQPMRGAGVALCDPVDKRPDNTFDCDMSKPLRVNSSHFGLTILRLARLKDLPMPWFLNVAGKDGGWRREDPTVVDADIYFWRKWKEAGRSLFILPWVSIGHIETVVSEVDPSAGKVRSRVIQKWLQDKFNEK